MYQMNPRIKGDYVRLAAALEADELKTGQVLHLWNVTDKEAIVEPAQFKEMHASTNQSILYLYQAWRQENKEPIRLVVVTKGGQFVSPEDDLHVEKTSLVGLLKTIPQEWKEQRCPILILKRSMWNRMQSTLLKSCQRFI